MYQTTIFFNYVLTMLPLICNGGWSSY